MTANTPNPEPIIQAKAEQENGVQAERDRLAQRIKDLEAERDSLQCSLAKVKRERDDCLKSIYAYVKKEFTKEDEEETKRILRTSKECLPLSQVIECLDRLAREGDRDALTRVAQQIEDRIQGKSERPLADILRQPRVA